MLSSQQSDVSVPAPETRMRKLKPFFSVWTGQVKENHPMSSKLYNNDNKTATTIYIAPAESERNLTIEIYT